MTTEITTLDARAIVALGKVTFLPGIPAKRFAKSIQRATQLSDKQRDYLWLLAYRYRGQIRDAAVVVRATELNVVAMAKVKVAAFSGEGSWDTKSVNWTNRDSRTSSA